MRLLIFARLAMLSTRAPPKPFSVNSRVAALRIDALVRSGSRVVPLPRCAGFADVPMCRPLVPSPLADRMEAFDASGKYLVAGPPPPAGRKQLHLLRAVITGGLDGAAERPEVDDAVAHHAAVVEQVACRHQKVTDVMREDAGAFAGAGDVAQEVRVPPQMVGVEHDADPAAQRVTAVARLRQRV